MLAPPRQEISEYDWSVLFAPEKVQITTNFSDSGMWVICWPNKSVILFQRKLVIFSFFEHARVPFQRPNTIFSYENSSPKLRAWSWKFFMFLPWKTKSVQLFLIVFGELRNRTWKIRVRLLSLHWFICYLILTSHTPGSDARFRVDFFRLAGYRGGGYL